MKHTHGGDVYRYRNCIDFSANCNPLGTPESVREAIRQCLDHLHEYPQVGSLDLLDPIADYEGVPKNQVICGNGAAEVIFSLCRALSPKKAMVLAPTFAEYEQALRSVNCDVQYFYLNQNRDFAVDESLLDAVTEELDIFFLCNPNNPTGMLTDREFLIRLLKKCRETGVFFVIDECFLDFVRKGDAYTMKAFLPEYDNLFLLKAFTKRYGMAGVRLGYGLSGNRSLLDTMEEMTQPWNVSTLAQAAGKAALLESDFLRKGREIALTEREYLRKELTDIGYHVYPSKANYLFFEARETLFEECRERGFLIRDCSNYPGLSKGFYRIAVRLHEDNEALIQTLREIERKK